MASTLLMSSPLLLLLLLVVAHSGDAYNVYRSPRFIPQQVCYDDLGCFSTGGNFFNALIRPIQLTPQSPEQVGATFELFTRKNRDSGQYLVYNDAASVRGSNFNGRRPTKVIVHGFTESTDAEWVPAMRRALLQRMDCNVVQVDWRGGNGFPYTQATANTRVVGAVTARLLLWLEKNFGASKASIHVIGFSLGAHIAGYIGARMGGQVARITGLDPAGPYFAGTHPEVRLDPTDAKFVDAIHTDGAALGDTSKFVAGFGLIQPVGHVDFYPNGGKQQPLCDNQVNKIIIDGIIKGTKWAITCNHVRALALMTESILGQEAGSKATPCRSYTDFKAGLCDCGSSGCATMGISADKWRANGQKHVKMYLDTAGKQPFSIPNYVVKVTVSKTAGAVRQFGDLSVKMNSSPDLSIVERQMMNVGKTVGAVVSNSRSLMPISTLVLSFRHRWLGSWDKHLLHVDRVDVLEITTGKRSAFCAKNAAIESGKSLTLTSRANGC